jgi:hypothetical protein
MFSTNGAGVVKGKVDSLVMEVQATEATIVTVQETHSTRKGKIQIEGFVVFEAIRKKKGGGTMCAIHKDLNPKLIEEYNDNFELLVVEVEVNNKYIRILTGYGPQENWEENLRLPFFLALEEEIVKAEMAGKSVIIELDANSKLGPQLIPGDPHNITPNGRLLAAVIERQNLFIVNGSTKCSGLITRIRKTKTNVEKSVIDIVLISSDLIETLVGLEIDETRKHVLTRMRKTKNGYSKKESDHNVLVTKFKSEFQCHNNKEKIEVFNLKNKICQMKFKQYTSNTNMLSSVLDSEEDIDTLTKRLLKKINGCIALNFKKVRICKKKEIDKEKMYNKMRELKKHNDPKSKNELAKVIEDIYNYEVEKYKQVVKELSKTKDTDAFNSHNFWKVKKKLCPRIRDPPSAMMDGHGNLLTSDMAIENRAVEVYSERLEGNQIKPHLVEIENNVNKLCETRLKITENNKSRPWTMEDLTRVLKELDNDKSRDALGQANELFKEEAAGTDLKLAVLKLMNLIKTRLKFPNKLQDCNITSIYKHKGSHKDFKSYRGVFRVTVFRSILDRLMYNDSYNTIDENLTDGNVGARKQRNVRDNIFVLGAVTNSVMNGSQAPIQVQIMDVETCFDKLWLQSTINALYEAGLTNDHLNLLYLENKNAQVAIKINNKLSRRINVKDVVMQGSVWGSLKCTTTMDILNKNILEQDHLQYKYRGDPNIAIGVLGMVDDTLSISECGMKSILRNEAINSFIENKRLTLSYDKSVTVHIGKESKCENMCPQLKVHDKIMKTSKSAKYIGDIVNSRGSVRDTVEKRRNKGWGTITQIMGLVSEVSSGAYMIQIGLHLRDTMLCNMMLFNAEAWSSISSKELLRLEQVDTALLRALMGGHSKCPTEFYYLELGVLMFRHILVIRRLMYHHHIISRKDNEIIKKIYTKQKETHIKGDWYEMVEKDFQFIGGRICDEMIKSMCKNEYKKLIKQKVEKSAFNEYMIKKENHTKLQDVKYDKLKIQNYLSNTHFNKEEIKIMCLLRSKCHPAKVNFHKMYKQNTKCTLGCNSIETQAHIFETCEQIYTKMKSPRNIILDYIYGSVEEQKSIVMTLVTIENVRQNIVKNLLPGGPARTRVLPTSLVVTPQN